MSARKSLMAFGIKDQIPNFTDSLTMQDNCGMGFIKGRCMVNLKSNICIDHEKIPGFYLDRQNKDYAEFIGSRRPNYRTRI